MSRPRSTRAVAWARTCSAAAASIVQTWWPGASGGLRQLDFGARLCDQAPVTLSMQRMREAVTRLSPTEAALLSGGRGPSGVEAAALAAKLGVTEAELTADADAWRDAAHQVLPQPAAVPMPAQSTASVFNGAVIEPASEAVTTIEGATTRALALDAPPEQRLASFRAEVLKGLGGRVPAGAAQAYAAALARLLPPSEGTGPAPGTTAAPLQSAVSATRGVVRTLDGQLDTLRQANARSYAQSQGAITAMQSELAQVLQSRSAGDDARVGAFFQVFQNNTRSQSLTRSWRTYQQTQAQFDTQLDALRADEKTLGPATETAGEPASSAALLAVQLDGLKQLLSNLERQAALLGEMVGHAGRTNSALETVRAQLQQSLADTRGWIASLEQQSTEALWGFVTGVAGFAAALSLSPAAIAVSALVNFARSAFLDDVEGMRAQVEALVWRALARVAAAGLVAAGVGELAARVLVGALRGAITSATGDRAEAQSLLTDTVRAGLNEAQRAVVDYLLASADATLPVSALVRGVIGFSQMTANQATQVIGALSSKAPGATLQGVDASLALLRAAVQPPSSS